MDMSIWRTLRSPQYLATCALAFLVSTFVTTFVLTLAMEHPRQAMMARGAPARHASDRPAEPMTPTAAQEQPGDPMAAVRFRVVSEHLPRPVAAQRVKDLSGQGIPACR